MLYTVRTKIEIQQVTPYTDNNGTTYERNELIYIPFLAEFEAESTWASLTQTLTVTLAKNASYATASGKVLYLGNTTALNSDLGGFNKTPVFMRGDIVKLYAGYIMEVNGNFVTDYSLNNVFTGFISSVSPKLPFTLQCEDAMWLCKQIPTPSKTWNKKTIQEIIRDIITDGNKLDLVKRYASYGITLSVSDFNTTDIEFNVTAIQTLRGSLAMFLDRLKNQYKVDSYFRGYELRCSLTHYIPADNVEHEFTFQRNIIEDNLTWQRRDDMQLSVIVKSHYTEEASGNTDDGSPKTKHGSTEVLVYTHISKTTDGFSYVKKQKGEPLPDNDIGERYTLNLFSPITDVTKLSNAGKEYLKKYYYDGFKGTFTTFGIPLVKHGDTVHIVDNILTERSGYYKVKAVVYKGGYDAGLRQVITIDYRIDG